MNAVIFSFVVGVIGVVVVVVVVIVVIVTLISSTTMAMKIHVSSAQQTTVMTDGWLIDKQQKQQ